MRTLALVAISSVVLTVPDRAEVRVRGLQKAATKAAAVPLPITSVSLYKNGVGF